MKPAPALRKVRRSGLLRSSWRVFFIAGTVKVSR